MQESIIVRGAREHNLKNIEIVIPRGKITVITGPSGSGKSSLAMDTIYAEGQRRYVESLSSYARQFLEQMEKPEVDSIEGLSPAIAIDQKTVSRSPRSTVGTITEIYDYMRVVYTRIGVPSCYECGLPIASHDISATIASVISLPPGTRIQILSPIIRERKGEHKKELLQMRREGFVRARIDGQMMDLTGDLTIGKQQRHTIEIVIDRFIIRQPIERQLKQAIQQALKYSETVVINLLDENRDILYSKRAACPKCGIGFPEIEPMLFSFNSKYGACPKCNGLGSDAFPEDEFQDPFLRPCSACRGMRLRKEALSIRVGGLNIGEFTRLPVRKARTFIDTLHLSGREAAIARRVIREISDRLMFLERVGIEYLSLDRPSVTLSGGEAQRIRLATQIGSSLTGVLYVLDEPSIGLHPRDCARLLETLVRMRDADNTVIIVEHNEDTIRRADHVIDMGPGAGHNGGRVIAEGTPSEIESNPSSITGQYLKGLLCIPVPARRNGSNMEIRINGAAENNLKDIDIVLPLGLFICVTGVSGSGKSSLIFEILYKALASRLYGGSLRPGRHRSIEGLEQIDRVICIDQSPLGKTPRSNPATYTEVFKFIRELYAQLPEARVRGYTSSRFSFNVQGGRCEACQGAGVKRIEMHFLPDVHVLCDSCTGKRYNSETCAVLYKGRSIADILAMSISQAREFFASIPSLSFKLATLDEMGLGYLTLGQPATTLSGGEAQRLRLSRELAKKATGSTLYILDEPTTGLHFVDIRRLITIIDGLVGMGNTVIVIEHDMDIIKAADHVIDLGPGSGDEGGWVIATGTPEEIAERDDSSTGLFLREKLRR